MSADRPIWRSLLFIPAHVGRFVAKAQERGADACILDLEDSVPLARKAKARGAVIAAARSIAAHGLDVLMRINAPPEATEDIDAAVDTAVRALVLPKIETAAQLQAVAQQLDRCEAQRGIAAGHTLLIAQIEHVRALPQLDAIATASPRLLGMILGSEDFSVSAGMEPVPEALLRPNQQVVFACRRAGILPFGFPPSRSPSTATSSASAAASRRRASWDSSARSASIPIRSACSTSASRRLPPRWSTRSACSPHSPRLSRRDAVPAATTGGWSIRRSWRVRRKCCAVHEKSLATDEGLP